MAIPDYKLVTVSLSITPCEQLPSSFGSLLCTYNTIPLAHTYRPQICAERKPRRQTDPKYYGKSICFQWKSSHLHKPKGSTWERSMTKTILYFLSISSVAVTLHHQLIFMINLPVSCKSSFAPMTLCELKWHRVELGHVE